jgi:hypothetical protein
MFDRNGDENMGSMALSGVLHHRAGMTSDKPKTIEDGEQAFATHEVFRETGKPTQTASFGEPASRHTRAFGCL